MKPTYVPPAPPAPPGVMISVHDQDGSSLGVRVSEKGVLVQATYPSSDTDSINLLFTLDEMIALHQVIGNAIEAQKLNSFAKT